jgi:hypothetical protein
VNCGLTSITIDAPKHLVKPEINTDNMNLNLLIIFTLKIQSIFYPIMRSKYLLVLILLCSIIVSFVGLTSFIDDYSVLMDNHSGDANGSTNNPGGSSGSNEPNGPHQNEPLSPPQTESEEDNEGEISEEDREEEVQEENSEEETIPAADLGADDTCGCGHDGYTHSSCTCNHDALRTTTSRSVAGLRCCVCGVAEPDMSCDVDNCCCVVHAQCIGE